MPEELERGKPVRAPGMVPAQEYIEELHRPVGEPHKLVEVPDKMVVALDKMAGVPHKLAPGIVEPRKMAAVVGKRALELGKPVGEPHKTVAVVGRPVVAPGMQEPWAARKMVEEPCNFAAEDKPPVVGDRMRAADDHHKRKAFDRKRAVGRRKVVGDHHKKQAFDRMKAADDRKRAFGHRKAEDDRKMELGCRKIASCAVASCKELHRKAFEGRRRKEYRTRIVGSAASSGKASENNRRKAWGSTQERGCSLAGSNRNRNPIGDFHNRIGDFHTRSGAWTRNQIYGSSCLTSSSYRSHPRGDRRRDVCRDHHGRVCHACHRNPPSR